MTALGSADPHGPTTPRSRSIQPSTATVKEVTTLLESPIETFRASAPFGVIASTVLADRIVDLSRWATGAKRTIGTLSDLARRTASVAVRVDIDMAIADSVALAEDVFAAVPATWSILHSAGYAGYWADGTWYRHVAFASLYRKLAEHGEVALHVDPFGLAAATDLDPAFALTAELCWLRETVGPITGISAHDAAPVHGAENFEIFDRWKLPVDGVPRSSSYQRWAGTLNATDNGIEWCAGAPRPGNGGDAARRYLGPTPSWPLQDGPWMRSYLHDGPYCRWFDGCEIWLIGDDRWVLSDRTTDRYLHAVDWEAVRSVLDSLDDDVVVSLCVHPVYVTRRKVESSPSR